MENYRLVIERRTPVYDADRAPATGGLARGSETLLLPVAGDGVSVDMAVRYQEIEASRPGDDRP